MISGLDISFYNYADDDSFTPDFVAMRKATPFVIIRAGQNNWIDPRFAESWQGAKAAGLARGSYWLYDSRIAPKTQADLWVSLFGGDWGEVGLWADFEEDYGGAYGKPQHVKEFLDYLKTLVPSGVQIGIYTALYWWQDRIENLGGDKAYFKQYPLWIANYGVSTPSIPSTWDRWEFWQYSETGDGGLYGLREGGKCDLNYYNGNEEQFRAAYYVPGPAQPVGDYLNEQIATPYNGVERHILNAFGANVWVYIIDPKQARLRVSGLPKFRQATQTVGLYKAQIVTNGGGWPYGEQDANEYWRSFGKDLHTSAKDNRPWIAFGAGGEVGCGQGYPPSKFTDCVGYDRYLVIDGKPNPRYATHPTKDARTFSGIRQDGKIVLCVAEGNDAYNVGLTFNEMAETLIHYGCYIGGNHDGGSSTTLVDCSLDCEAPQNLPSDKTMAYVINSILLFADGEQTETQPEEENEETNMTIYKITETQSRRPAPSLGSSSIGAGVPAGVLVTSELYHDTNATFYSQYGAEFVKLPTGEYQCVKNKGVWFAQLVTDPTPETPSGASYHVVMTNSETGETYEGDLLKK